jgi:hypothetical protein
MSARLVPHAPFGTGRVINRVASGNACRMAVRYFGCCRQNRDSLTSFASRASGNGVVSTPLKPAVTADVFHTM